MLFNSYEFIFLFLPVTLAIFFLLGRLADHRFATSWLVLVSLLFYGWWNPIYLLLITASIVFNYFTGMMISRGARGEQHLLARGLMFFGVVINLMVLGWFKYANFFVDNTNVVLQTEVHLASIVLPLAISFFTFQQITYLVDTWKGETHEYNFRHYCLFVTFFPQLIAGPIVHHREMLPQFAKESTFRVSPERLSVGVTIFTIGLFKKVILADGIAAYANPIFAAAENGFSLSFLEAWGGVLAYTFQLYFDFSGYSDMAIGLGHMFGITLPLNFHSPYKAINIIDFWRRWHITLSRFLRDYVYIPLGGNRRGSRRRYGNLLATMLLGGLWHGAGWTFVAWGGLHGFYLAVNNGWRGLRKRIGHDLKTSTTAGRFSSGAFTFLLVVIAWVAFRATSFEGAIAMWKAMTGFNGVLVLPAGYESRLGGIAPWLSKVGWEFNGAGEFALASTWLLILAYSPIVWKAPNTQQLMTRYSPALIPENLAFDLTPKRHAWVASTTWAIGVGLMIVVCIMNLASVSEFLYFQF